jgi:transposase
MSYKLDHFTIGKDKDKRIKIPETEHERIRELYKDPKTSQRTIAKMYNVSRRLIQFILDPEKEKQNKAQAKAQGGYKRYYDKAKRREYMQRHRDYKRELLKNI